MKTQSFHGYNCYSAVVEEICKRDSSNLALDLINTQISFYFDKNLFWGDEWFAGSMISPIDELLDFDLKYFLGIEKSKCIGKFDDVNELNNMINEKKHIFALVDFFLFGLSRLESAKKI